MAERLCCAALGYFVFVLHILLRQWCAWHLLLQPWALTGLEGWSWQQPFFSFWVFLLHAVVLGPVRSAWGGGGSLCMAHWHSLFSVLGQHSNNNGKAFVAAFASALCPEVARGLVVQQ